MPFTLSHPAVAVPLARGGLVLSALVVGSMAPDFQYFVNLTTEDRFSHSLPGIFQFCLPMGLLVLALFHYLLKLPLLSLFPVSHQQRLLPVARRFHCRTAIEFFMIVISLLIGTITHIIWDSFTHDGHWAVERFPLLDTTLIKTPDFNIKVCLLLQHGSSLFGALVLIYWYVRWFKQAPRETVDTIPQLEPRLKTALLCAMAVWAVFFALLYSLDRTPAVTGFFWFQRFLRYAVIGGMGAIYVELLLYSIGWHLWKKKETVHAS